VFKFVPVFIFRDRETERENIKRETERDSCFGERERERKEEQFERKTLKERKSGRERISRYV